MAKLDERLQMIGAAILAQANAEAQQIIDKANTIRSNEIAQCEDVVVQNMFGVVQEQSAAIRQESVKITAKAQAQAHRELHLRREEFTAQVFAAASKRLLAYTATPAYREKLLLDLYAYQGQYNSATVFVRKDDLALSSDILKAAGCSFVEADPAIKLGGFRLRTEKILIDETLDTKLQTQRPLFMQTCGLKVL